MKTLKIDPDFKLAYISLANTYVEIDKKEEALAAFIKASKYFDDNSLIYYNIGKLYTLTVPPNNAEAIINFSKAISINPDYPEALLGRIQILMGTEKLSSL